MKFKIKGIDKIFETSGEAYDYIIEHEEEGISMEDIEEIPEEEKATIEESPKENPSDVEVITERELEERLAVLKALEDYSEYDALGKKEILQQGLSKTENKTQGERRLKTLPKRRTTKSVIYDEYQKILDVLASEESHVCPICNRPYEENLEKLEELSWREMYPELEEKFPKIHLTHVRSRHPAIWEFIKTLFEIPESQRMERAERPFTSNPEACSLEELSKEELAQEISSNPELRKELFRRYKKQLEEKRK